MVAAGQNDLFGIDQPAEELAPPKEARTEDPDWEDDLWLQGEKETLGLYLTGHPIDRFESDLSQLGVARLDSFSVNDLGRGGERARVAGYVVDVHRRPTQRGYMANVLLDDRKGRMEAVFFSENYEAHRDLLTADRVLVVEGSVVKDDFRGGLTLRADRAVLLEELRLMLASRLNLKIGMELIRQGHWRVDTFIEHLGRHLSPFRGGACQVIIDYCTDYGSGTLVLGEEWRVEARDELLRQLRNMLGEQNLSVSYRRGSLPGNGEDGTVRQARHRS